MACRDPIVIAQAGSQRSYLWFAVALSLYAAAFLAFSETRAYSYDEGYHLLAAQLIDKGKIPYLDFCFPQTPLNAWWNAGWMRLLGQSWRVAHLVAALLTIGAVVLTADFVFRRFPVADWRFAAAIAAGIATGCNAMVFLFGPVAQAYGICLFTLVAAFRISVRAVDRSGPWLPALVGLCAGVAAGSSLLSAAAAPALLGWMLFYNRAGSRWTKLIAFGIGTAVPFAPVFWLFWRGPKQTWFNVFQYHFYFRRLYWPETTRHDIEILTSWIDSGQGLILGLLAVFGLIFIARRGKWPDGLKAEFYLCAWLAAALSLEICRAHPTFSQYFLLIVPFLAIPAVAGLYAIGSRVLEPDRPAWPVLLVSVLVVFGLGRSLLERETGKWRMYRREADQVERVTPPNAPVFANEQVYFLTRRTPPAGLELYYTHKVQLPPADAALFHILSEADLKRLIASGMFPTAASCEDDDIDQYGLSDRYRQHVTIDDCTVFWDWKK